MTFVDAFDIIYSLKFNLDRILGMRFQLVTITDRRSLFYALTKINKH